MARLLYLLSHSTDDPRRTAVGLEAAAAAADADHEVGLWLSDEGVRLAVNGVVDALLEEGPQPASESLAALQAKHATLHVSRPCFASRGFAPAQLVEGAKPAEPAALADLVAAGWVPLGL